jgi:hypothetical protein
MQTLCSQVTGEKCKKGAKFNIVQNQGTSQVCVSKKKTLQELVWGYITITQLRRDELGK